MSPRGYRFSRRPVPLRPAARTGPPLRAPRGPVRRCARPPRTGAARRPGRRPARPTRARNAIHRKKRRLAACLPADAVPHEPTTPPGRAHCADRRGARAGRPARSTPRDKRHSPQETPPHSVSPRGCRFSRTHRDAVTAPRPPGAAHSPRETSSPARNAASQRVSPRMPFLATRREATPPQPRHAPPRPAPPRAAPPAPPHDAPHPSAPHAADILPGAHAKGARRPQRMPRPFGRTGLSPSSHPPADRARRSAAAGRTRSAEPGWR